MRSASMETMNERFAAVQSAHLMETDVEELPQLISNLTQTFGELQKEEMLPEIQRL